MAQPFDLLHPDDPRPDARRALRVWLALQRHFVFRPQDARRALSAASSPEALLRTQRGARLASEAEVAVLRRCDAALVPFGSSFYPERLARLVDAPPVLLVRGDPATLLRPGVAIVGARAATAYGRDATRRFASALARAGACVVSGLANGIDGEAHRAALDAGGASLAVQACGPERVYPARHVGLARRLAESGAVVTEFPVGMPPRAPHFPLRNRIISALADAVLVVEARLRSGSLITARHAADQGVDVWAVPGPIDAPTSEGPHRLLADGAGVAYTPEFMLDELGWPSASTEEEVASVPDGAAGEVWHALAAGAASPDTLGERTGQEAAVVGRALVALEVAGLVLLDRDGRYRRISPRRERGLS